MKLLNGVYCASFIVTIALLSGCATFPQQNVAVVKFPVSDVAAQKPDAYVDIKFFQGLPSATAQELAPSRPGMDRVVALVRDNVSKSGLFNSVSYDGGEKDAADLQLTVRVYNHGEVSSAAMLGAFITGLTLYVVPSRVTEEYTVQIDVADKAGNQITRVANQDSMNFWQGWVFLPMAGNTLFKGLEDTVGNQVRAALKEAYDSGKLDAAYQQLDAAALLN